MLVENFTVSFGDPPFGPPSMPQAAWLVQTLFPSFKYRYSIRAVRFSVNAASRPAPAVQPPLVVRWKVPASPAATSPSAPPAVP